MISSCSKVNNALLVLAGSVFIAIASNLSIPIGIVPVTFQTTAVFLLSAILGGKLGMYSVLAYLLEGCIGLPVFADFSAGPQVLLGNTGGYLVGFLPAAYISGMLFQKAANMFEFTVAIVLGLFVVFLCGYLQLSIFVGYKAAYCFGIVHFAITETCKTVITVLLINKIKNGK